MISILINFKRLNLLPFLFALFFSFGSLRAQDGTDNNPVVRVIYSSKANGNMIKPVKRYIMYEDPVKPEGHPSTMAGAWWEIDFGIFIKRMKNGYIELQPFELFIDNNKLRIHFYSSYSQDYNADHLIELDLAGNILRNNEVKSILGLEYQDINKRKIQRHFFPDDSVLGIVRGDDYFRCYSLFLGRDRANASYYLILKSDDPYNEMESAHVIVKTTVVNSKLRYQKCYLPYEMSLGFRVKDIGIFYDPYNKIVVDKDANFYEIKHIDDDVVIYKFKPTEWEIIK